MGLCQGALSELPAEQRARERSDTLAQALTLRGAARADPGHRRGVCAQGAGRAHAGRGGLRVQPGEHRDGAPPGAGGGPAVRHLLRRGRRRRNPVRAENRLPPGTAGMRARLLFSCSEGIRHKADEESKIIMFRAVVTEAAWSRAWRYFPLQGIGSATRHCMSTL